MQNKIVFSKQTFSPSKIVCVGRNYVDHIHELGNEIPSEMVVFIKPNSAISSELISYHHEEIHYEGEICFVYLQGSFKAVGFGLDLTKRTLQNDLKSKGLPWERSKAFDGSALFSDFVPIYDVTLPLTLTLAINDTLIQAGGVESMIYKPEQVLKEIQSFMTLEDGDIVMTGTPKGVGIVKAGDAYTGTIYQEGSVVVQQTWIAK